MDDDCGDASEGCTTEVAEGFAEAAEEAAEGYAAVEPFMFFLATFLSSVVAAAEVSFVVEAAAASLRAYLASLDIFLHSKHVRRGFMVPFLIFSRK